MLFSSPDYPLFLIAVFFLYGLARWGGGVRAAWARLAVMVLLGDVVFVLVAKDPDTLWDPIGGVVLRLAASGDRGWPPWLLGHWVIGGGVLGAAIALGKRRAAWIGSDRGQRAIARGVVVVLAAIGAVVGVASWSGALDAVTAEVVAHGHLGVVVVLGVGLGIGLDPSPGGHHRPLGRVVILFVASSLFYHAWASAMPGPYRYLLGLLLATIVLDYYLAIWIERTADPRRRKALVIVSLCSNLGILVVFKYADFFTHDVLRLDVERLNLILPAGISFHTFQSLSYTIDVYRKELRATRSVVEFATFVLFFPQLVAGPIVRAQDLLPQLAHPPPLELAKATHGLFRILVGLFKKIALADVLALSIVDRVFEAPENFSSVEVAAGVYGYALQIYLDFSAYSDIAIGSAMVLGFTLPENFRAPYRASDLQAFWRRWHISLSTWLRDYLYITLGGSQGTQARTYLNLIATMLLGGLWHGASWAFVVWGALHGFGLAVTRYFQRSTAGAAASAWRLLAWCVAIAALGLAVQRDPFPGDAWLHLLVTWLGLMPLWAVLTAWLGREPAAAPAPVVASSPPSGLPWRALWTSSPAVLDDARPHRVIEGLRLAMCAAGLGVLLALAYAESWTWIPLVAVTWSIAQVADALERADQPVAAWLAAVGRRAIAVVLVTPYLCIGWLLFPDATAARRRALLRELVPWLPAARRAVAAVLVFHYVCFAWIFFRATSFDNALAVLRQLALLETDHANVGPVVAIALVAGFACHGFPDGSFRWLRDRFVALPAWAQGAVLAAAALVLRELGQTKIVPFIYFQF